MNKFCNLLALALVLLLAQESWQSTSARFRRAVSQSNRRYQCGTRKRQIEGLITNGSKTKLGEWPWHGGLFHRKNRRSREYKCGATLIDQSFVVTAGHCVVDRESGYEVNTGAITVDFGYVQLFSPSSHGQSHSVQEIFVHPKFAKDSNKHDVALLALKTAVRFSDYILPICVEFSTTKSETSIRDIIGKEGVVVGWGLTEDDENSSDLRLARVPVADYAECQESDPDLFGALIYPGMFCAGSRDGTSVCNGDSGGGMYVKSGRRWTLRGITSFSGIREDGSNKCDVNNYAGFMNVRYYVSWIRQIVQGEDDLADELFSESPTTIQPTHDSDSERDVVWEALNRPIEPVAPIAPVLPFAPEVNYRRNTSQSASSCVPNPCGLNAICRETNRGRPVCSCPLGYDGNPLTSCRRSECLDNVECRSDQICQQGNCVTDCADACGINARCDVRNHVAVCSCPRNMEGDPFVRCRPSRRAAFDDAPSYTSNQGNRSWF